VPTIFFSFLFRWIYSEAKQREKPFKTISSAQKLDCCLCVSYWIITDKTAAVLIVKTDSTGDPFTNKNSQRHQPINRTRSELRKKKINQRILSGGE